MPRTDAGATLMAQLLIGEAVSALAANARLGVGDGNTAFSASQTDLVGTNRTRKVVDSPPTRSGLTITLQATFGSGEAIHAWTEWGAFTAQSNGVMVTRKVETISASAKPSGDSWRLIVDLVCA